MRATCPSCEATYEIPDRLIGTGRRLRCTNCGHEWTLLPAVAEAPDAAAAEKPPASAPPPPETSPPPPPPPRAEPRPAPAASARAAHPMLRRPPQVIDPPLPRMGHTAGWRGPAALRAAWIGSVLLVVLALLVLWAFRHEIAATWSPAARLVGAPLGGV